MYNSIVLVKQVPDTANISGKVMKDDGTVNRSKLPAIFNYEDKVSLELALQIKERYGGSAPRVRYFAGMSLYGCGRSLPH